MELLLVVAGIYIDFELERWNDDRLDQKKADEYRQQLVMDMQVEADDVDTLIACCNGSATMLWLH